MLFYRGRYYDKSVYDKDAVKDALLDMIEYYYIEDWIA